MIDAKSGDRARAYQFKNQAMNGVEDFWQLDADGGQIVYVKKAAVIDFLGSDPPKSQTIRLCVQQFVQLVEDARVTALSVNLYQRSFDRQLHFRSFGATP